MDSFFFFYHDGYSISSKGFLSTVVPIKVRDHFWAIYAVYLIYVSVFLCSYHNVLITVDFSLKSRSLILPAFFCFLEAVLANQSLLHFHINFRIVSTSSVGNTIYILIVISLNLKIALGSIIILTIVILLVQEHNISLQ